MLKTKNSKPNNSLVIIYSVPPLVLKVEFGNIRSWSSSYFLHVMPLVRTREDCRHNVQVTSMNTKTEIKHKLDRVRCDKINQIQNMSEDLGRRA
jgi:hypothetical protein